MEYTSRFASLVDLQGRLQYDSCTGTSGSLTAQELKASNRERLQRHILWEGLLQPSCGCVASASASKSAAMPTHA